MHKLPFRSERYEKATLPSAFAEKCRLAKFAFGQAVRQIFSCKLRIDIEFLVRYICFGR